MRILILTHSFPPLNVVSSLRVYSFAKYLSLLGHHVVVLTTSKRKFDGALNLDQDCSMFRVVEVPYLSWFFGKESSTGGGGASKWTPLLMKLKRYIRFFRRKIIGALLDIHDFWVFPARKVAIDIVLSEEIDTVISSYGPTSPHYLASILKQKFPHIFWLADYRDLWSFLYEDRLFFPFRQFQNYVERFTVRGADAFTTVSPHLKTVLINEFSKPVELIYNGFLSQDVSSQKCEASKENDAPLIITYTGTIYPIHRDPTPLFRAISSVLAEKVGKERKIEVHFYGGNVDLLLPLVEKMGMSSVVKIHSAVTRKEVLEIQRQSDVLLMLESNKPEARGVLTGKLFEYFVSSRPILAVGVRKDSDMGDLISKTATGVVCGVDVLDIQKVLTQFLTQNYVYEPNWEWIQKFRRDIQVEKLSAFIADQRL